MSAVFSSVISAHRVNQYISGMYPFIMSTLGEKLRLAKCPHFRERMVHI